MNSINLLVMLETAKWDPTLSDPTLVFSNFNSTVMRDGATSCYPCAKADFVLDGAGDGFGVKLDVLFNKNNSLTIGIADHSAVAFPKDTSNGVGDEPGSVGLHIENVRNYLKRPGQSATFCPVSYTHLTLPTIYSV